MKNVKQSVVLLLSLGFMLYAAAAKAAFSDVTGPYPVTTLSNVGPNGAYYIFRPTTLYNNTHPLAVFCVGTNGSPTNGSTLFTSLASHGIVVIAGTNPNQRDGTEAIDGIEWLISQNTTVGSPYYGKLDTSKVLAFGLSQGGNAALWTAIKDPNITTVIAMAPGATPAQAPKAPPASIEVPILYISGGGDRTVRAENVLAQYNANVGSSAWYACKKYVVHTGILLNTYVDYYIRAWVYTHFYNDAAARAKFYGTSWGLKTDTNFKDQRKNNSLN